MKRSFAAIALAAVALTACSKKSTDTSVNVAAPSGPIAAVPPPAGKQWTDVVSETAEGGYVMGNPNAPVKLSNMPPSPARIASISKRRVPSRSNPNMSRPARLAGSSAPS